MVGLTNDEGCLIQNLRVENSGVLGELWKCFEINGHI